jgi:hypothetical protein
MSAATAAFLRSGRRMRGDGCAASHPQPSLLLVTQLATIADTEAGDPGICNGPILCEKSARYICTLNFEGCGHAESKKALKFVLRTALRPNQIEFSHSLGHELTHAPQQTWTWPSIFVPEILQEPRRPKLIYRNT